jgi:hypothetical protein
MAAFCRSTFTVFAAKKVAEVGKVKTNDNKKFANISAAVSVLFPHCRPPSQCGLMSPCRVASAPPRLTVYALRLTPSTLPVMTV